MCYKEKVIGSELYRHVVRIGTQALVEMLLLGAPLEPVSQLLLSHQSASAETSVLAPATFVA